MGTASVTDTKRMVVLNADNEPLTMKDLPPADFTTRWTLKRKHNAVQAYRAKVVGSTVIDETFIRDHWKMSPDEMKAMIRDVDSKGMQGMSVRHLKEVRKEHQETMRAEFRKRRRGLTSHVE